MRRPTRKPAIHDAYEFDSRSAAREFRAAGYVMVDDIGERLYDVLRDELIDALGHEADECRIETDRVETGWGPVLVFRDVDRVSKREAEKQVFESRPREKGACEPA